MLWLHEGTCFLPVFLVVWSSGTFIINYVIAVLRRDVDVVFPYISDVGVQPPESCIFSFMATISAFAGFATMFSRYKFVQMLTDKSATRIIYLNRAALVFASLSCLGMCIVASFQETALPPIHDVGAGFFFVFGVVYIILQTIITHFIYPYGSSRCVFYIRAAFAVVALLAVLTTIIFASFVKPSKVHWKTDDKYYSYHVVSAVFEWTSAFTLVFFFLTYVQEFKQFNMRVDVESREFT